MIIAPITVHRVNSLPAEAFDVDLRRTSALLAELAGVQDRLRGDADRVSDVLYKIVPQLDDDPALRRAVLSLRRALHNGKLPVVPADRRAQLLCRLGAEGALLDNHLAAFGRREALRSAAAQAYAEEVPAASARLGALLDIPAFAQALAHASADLLRHLRPTELRPGGKPSRGLLAYAARAATKTSPFSRFTGLALDGAPADGHAQVAVAQQHVRRWIDQLARDQTSAAAFRVAPNRSVVLVGARHRLIMPDVRPGTALSWRGDTVVDAELYADVLTALSQWPEMPVPEFLDRLGGDDPFAGYLRLLDTSLIRLVLPWPQTAERPLLYIADALQSSHPPAAREARELQRRIDALHRVTGRDRLAAMDELRLGGRPVTVYEDTVADVQVEFPADRVDADLRTLAELARPYIFRSHLYDWLVTEFVTRYGEGRECPDAYAFVMAVATAPDFLLKFGRALTADRALFEQPSDRAWFPVADSSAPPSATVLYQLGGAVPTGDYRLVVNQFNVGLGGLVARFRRLLDTPTGTGLTGRLRDWVGDAFPHSRTHEMTLCADLNSMQLDAAGILPRYLWPGEPPTADADDPLTTLRIRHQAQTGTLLLTDSTGTPVSPVYLGVVPAHLMSGAVRLLLCLADPWVNGALHLSCTYSPLEQLEPPGQEVVAEAARRHGRLITRRRNWRLSPATFPTPRPAETPFGFVARMDAWRRIHDLPDEVYMSLESSAGLMADHSDRKPLWLSFRSAHAVLAAAANPRLATATAVRLTEALPARTDYWVRDADGHHRAAEHVSLLRWERPTGRSDIP